MSSLVTIIGIPELAAKINEVTAAAEEHMAEALIEGGTVIKDEWVRNIIDMGAVDTGRYRDSVDAQVTGPAEVTVGSDIVEPSPYPEYVEYGTYKMAARPAARQAIDTTEESVMTAIAEGMKKIFVPFGG